MADYLIIIIIPSKLSCMMSTDQDEKMRLKVDDQNLHGGGHFVVLDLHFISLFRFVLFC